MSGIVIVDDNAYAYGRCLPSKVDSDECQTHCYLEEELTHQSTLIIQYGQRFGRSILIPAFGVTSVRTPPSCGRSTKSAVFFLRIRVLPAGIRENRDIFGVPSPFRCAQSF